MILSVRSDVVDTVGVAEGAQGSITCDDKILVVTGIWAGYDSEAPSDLLSFSCSEWDKPTTYVTVIITQYFTQLNLYILFIK